MAGTGALQWLAALSTSEDLKTELDRFDSSSNKRKQSDNLVKNIKREKRRKTRTKTKSKYLSLMCVGGTWKYSFGSNGEWLGAYKTELEAVAARDKHYLKHSKFPGVSFHQRASKWQARYTLNGKWVSLGYRKSFPEAVEVIKRVESSEDVEAAIIVIRASNNASSEIIASKYLNVACVDGTWKYRFGSGEWLGGYETEAEAVAGRDKCYLDNGKYPGVSFHKGDSKWLTNYTLNGKRESLGCYKSFDIAMDKIKRVEASDDIETVIRGIQASNNASSDITLSKYLSTACIDGTWKFRFCTGAWQGEYDTEEEAVAARDKCYLEHDKYPGVTFDKKSDRYKVTYPLNGKWISMGQQTSFGDAVDIIKRVEASDDAEAAVYCIRASNKAAATARKASKAASSSSSTNSNNAVVAKGKQSKARKK